MVVSRAGFPFCGDGVEGIGGSTCDVTTGRPEIRLVAVLWDVRMPTRGFGMASLYSLLMRRERGGQA